MATKKFSHGRGGAGNICTSTVDYVDGLNYSPPILKPENTPRFTTGRGGAGNICKYDPQAVRLAQDVPEGIGHIPHVTHAGRGGVGNLQAMKKRDSMNGQSMTTDGRVSHESANTSSTARTHVSTSSSISEAGLADWAKNKLFRRRTSNDI